MRKLLAHSLFHTPGSKYTESIVQYVLSVSVCGSRLSSDELKKSRPRHQANYRAAVTRVMEQGMGICLAAIMTCVRLKLRGNAEKQVVGGGGNQKNYHSVEKSSCSYIV